MPAVQAADTASNDHLRLYHLIVDFLDHVDVALVDATRNQEDIGMFGVARIDDAKTLDIIERRECGQHLDITAVTARTVVMYDPRRF